MIESTIHLVIGLGIMGAIIGLAWLSVIAYDDYKHRLGGRRGPDSRR